MTPQIKATNAAKNHKNNSAVRHWGVKTALVILYLSAFSVVHCFYDISITFIMQYQLYNTIWMLGPRVDKPEHFALPFLLVPFLTITVDLSMGWIPSRPLHSYCFADFNSSVPDWFLPSLLLLQLLWLFKLSCLRYLKCMCIEKFSCRKTLLFERTLEII